MNLRYGGGWFTDDYCQNVAIEGGYQPLKVFIVT